MENGFFIALITLPPPVRLIGAMPLRFAAAKYGAAPGSLSIAF
jgi:hypothetical protein